ncbi:sulfatase [Halosimplex amylolyticum]|uniref:sulfatase n=1 Tax=Halosimplex amylolyticum TaxID=3396616 RepID=UPI003F56DD60
MNVLLLTVDSLRKDAVPGDGFGPDLLDGSVRDSVSETRFERAFATGPGTTPSFPAMLTGTMPLSYGGLGPLSPDRPRVADVLRNEGYATGGFQCNPFLSTHFEYDAGFDAFEDYQNPLMGLATKIFPRGIEINNPKLRTVDEYLHLTDGIRKTYQLVRGKPRPYVSADVITDDTIEWLDGVDSPFFCWTHYMDVHHPCFPPERYRERYGVGSVTQSDVGEWYSAVLDDPASLTDDEIETLHRLYRASIAYTADQAGRILDHLEAIGELEDTLVILTSDHGELFGDWGQHGKPERMYDELLHVPLIVLNGPDHLDDATDDLVSLLDVPPLIHDALDLDVPAVYEGRRPGVDDPREYVVAEHEVEGDVVVGARSREWLYERDELRDEERLFDLRDGDARRVSVADHAREAAAVRRAVSARFESLDLESERWDDEIEGDVESRLEELGYLS